MSAQVVEAFVSALGAEMPRGDWTVHVRLVAMYSFLDDERSATATLAVYGGTRTSWEFHVISAYGDVCIEDGAVTRNDMEVRLPSSLLEVPQLLVAIAAVFGDGVRWQLKGAAYGGNRVLSKQLRTWLNAQMPAP